MPSNASLKEAVGKLRGVLASARESNETFQEVASDQAEVLARYQPVFSPDGIASLTEEEFRGFLKFENNRTSRFAPVSVRTLGQASPHTGRISRLRVAGLRSVAGRMVAGVRWGRRYVVVGRRR